MDLLTIAVAASQRWDGVFTHTSMHVEWSYRPPSRQLLVYPFFQKMTIRVDI